MRLPCQEETGAPCLTTATTRQKGRLEAALLRNSCQSVKAPLSGIKQPVKKCAITL